MAKFSRNPLQKPQFFRIGEGQTARLFHLKHIHPDFLFSSIPPSPPPKQEHSLLVLPSVNAILNFATKFFEMLTKKQSKHPQIVFQVFQVFRVFQVFHFAFGTQNSPILVQIRTKPTNRYPPTSATKWMRKTPKKAIHPLVYEHDTVCAIGAVFFGEADFFSAKRLFLREARDVSGAHRVPPWARVEIKLKTSFLVLSLSSSHAWASALTSPPPDFLLSSIPPKPPNLTKSSSRYQK